MSDHKVAELESGLFVCALAMAALENRLDTFNRENAHLRVVAQQVACPYGMRAANGACTLGYPGCACMDDVSVLMQYYPADGRIDALERMMTRNDVLQKRLLNAIERVNLAAKNYRALADGFRLERVSSKAAAAQAMADLMESPL